MQTSIASAATSSNDQQPARSEQRARLLSTIVRALLAGIIVRLGTHVFALRERGEIINDGTNAVEALGDGLFERFEGFSLDNGKHTPITRWAVSWDHGASPVRPVRLALDELSEEHVALLQISFTAATALSAPAIANALRTGMRLADPPTRVFE